MAFFYLDYHHNFLEQQSLSMGNQKPIKSMIIIQVTLFNEGKPNLEQTERCLQDTKQSFTLHIC